MSAILLICHLLCQFMLTCDLHFTYGSHQPAMRDNIKTKKSAGEFEPTTSCTN
jgi:hypothetical protein